MKRFKWVVLLTVATVVCASGIALAGQLKFIDSTGPYANASGTVETTYKWYTYWWYGVRFRVLDAQTTYQFQGLIPGATYRLYGWVPYASAVEIDEFVAGADGAASGQRGWTLDNHYQVYELCEVPADGWLVEVAISKWWKSI